MTSQNTHLHRKRKKITLFDKYFGKYGLWITIVLATTIGGIIYQDFLSFEKLFYFKDIGSDTINTQYVRLMNERSYGTAPYDIGDWTFYRGMGEALRASNFRLPTITQLPKNISELFSFTSNDFFFYQVSYVQWFALILCSLIAFFYFRVMAFSTYSAIIGALLVSFCGWAIVGGTWHTHIQSVLRCVFVLLSFELLFRKKIWLLFPISIYYLSVPELYFYTQFLTVYATVRFLSVKGWNIKGLLQLGGKMVLLGGIALLFKAPNLFYSVNKIVGMSRVSGTASFVDKLSDVPIFSLESSLHYFTAFMRTYANDLLGNGSQFQGWRNYLEAPAFYCGLPILLLIPQIFVSLNNRQRLLYAAFLLFWLIIIIFPFFRYAFYKFSGSYYKAALSFFIPLTMVFMGIQALSRLDKARILNKWLLLITLILLLFGLYYPYSTNLGNRIDTSLQMIIAVFLVAEAGFIYLLSLKRWKKWAYIGLLVTVCLEVGYLNHQTINQRDALTTAENQAKIGYNDYTMEAVEYLKGIDKSFYRCTKDYSSGLAIHGSLNDAQAQGFYGTPSYQSANSKYYINFLQAVEAIGTGDVDTRWSNGVRGQPVLQSLCSVKYAFTKGSGANFEPAGYQLINQFENVKVLKNNLALPLGFAYDSFILYEDYKSLNKFQKSIALLKAVVVSKSQLTEVEGLKPYNLNNLAKTAVDYGTQYGQDIEERKKNVLDINQHSDNTIGGNITLAQPMMVFFSIPYHQGWTAFVDGEEKSIVLADMGLMGVMTPAGTHKVEIKFVPPFTFIGNIVFFLILALYLVIIWWNYRRKAAHEKLLIIGLCGLLLVPFIRFPFWELFFVIIAISCWLGLFKYPSFVQKYMR